MKNIAVAILITVTITGFFGTRVAAISSHYLPDTIADRLANATTTRYEYYTEEYLSDVFWGNYWKGQTFTPAISHTITSVKLRLHKIGSASGEVVVGIKATDANGLPTGGNLASGSLPCSSIAGYFDWHEFDLGDGYELDAGTTYAIVWQAPDSDYGNRFYFKINTEGTYPGGWVLISNGGTNWNDLAGRAWDAVFEEWGVSEPAGNHAPIANDDDYEVSINTILSIPAPGVLGNDIDIDHDSLKAILDSDVSNGTLVLNDDGSFTYTPDTDWGGMDSFSYHANDGNDNSNSNIVTLNVSLAHDNRKKVIIRNDDVFNFGPSLQWISNLIVSKNIKATYAVIPAYLPDNPLGLAYINNLDKQYFEIANHGYAHEVFQGLSYEEQYSLLSQGTEFMEIHLETKPYTFVPPFSSADIVTTKVCKDLGFHSISSYTPIQGSYVADFCFCDFSWELWYSGTYVHQSFSDFTMAFDDFYSKVKSDPSDQVFVILIHDKTFFDEQGQPITAATTDFEKSIDYMKERNVEFITVEEAYQSYIAPIANDDDYEVSINTILSIPAPGVLGNDIDIDHDSLTAILDSDVSNGTLVLNDDGSFTYTPDTDWGGMDSFSYHANDGNDDSNVATVSITVSPATTLPFTLRVNAGGGAYIDTLTNTWVADYGYTGGRIYNPGTPVTGTTDDPIYQSLHYDLTGYSFSVPNGTYTVTLHFAEMYFTSPDSRVFDTTIESILQIDDLDIVAEAGPATALTRQFTDITVTDGQLDIGFSAVVDYPQINGIEIVAYEP